MRENVNHQAEIAFSFVLDLLRSWLEFPAKPKLSWISFDIDEQTAVWYCTSLRNTALLVTPTEYPGFMFTSLQHNGVFIASSKRSLDTSTDNCGNGFMMTAPSPLLKLYSRLLISFKMLWTVTLEYLNILTRDSVSLHKSSFWSHTLYEPYVSMAEFGHRWTPPEIACRI